MNVVWEGKKVYHPGWGNYGQYAQQRIYYINGKYFSCYRWLSDTKEIDEEYYSSVSLWKFIKDVLANKIKYVDIPKEEQFDSELSEKIVIDAISESNNVSNECAEKILRDIIKNGTS
jgi:hypothetical protein